MSTLSILPPLSINLSLALLILSAPLSVTAEDGKEPMTKHEAQHKGHAHKSHEHQGDGHRPAHHHSFEPERFVKRWEGPTRDQEQRPRQVLKACGVTAGMSVVDLGAGTGYFLPYLSSAVGDAGHVQALDLEPKMVSWMQERIKKEGLKNVTALETQANQTPLKDASVDRILIVNVWHHIDDRATYLSHLVSKLKPHGALCVVEIKRDAPHGPPIKHRLSPKELSAELSREARLEVVIDPLTLPNQYLVIGELR